MISPDQAIEAVFREEYGGILASLIRTCRDIELAEEALGDALLAACERWPKQGTPSKPGAWLMSIVCRRAIDRLRRRRAGEQRIARLEQEQRVEAPGHGDPSMQASDEFEDDRLRLIFTCCHPAIAHEAQVALTLNTLCGLSTQEIARAFLVRDQAMAQRLVRAKRKIRGANIPYRVPPPGVLPERLPAVLAVVYLVFNEGYAASRGAELQRWDLCHEAIRLGRLLHDRMPEQPDVRALLALMLLQGSRRDARMDGEGRLVLLEDQERTRWDRDAIEEGLALVEAALRAGAAGPYALQAAIAALHAEARRAADTDWPQIVALYDALMRASPSPVVALNRAAAVAMAQGPRAGLRALAPLIEREELRDYVYLHSTRADLERRLGNRDQARASYRRAIELARSTPELEFLRRRLAQLEEPAADS